MARTPGRSCPRHYRYSPAVFARAADLEAQSLYIVGGLYGNPFALEAVLAMARREGAALVFNGDFRWLDVGDGDFAHVTREVLRHPALRGSVETEIAGEDSGVGCGCAYPADVGDAEVARSNEILLALRATASRAPDLRARLDALPMDLVARVGRARVGIVHGDAASLAGWGFAHEQLDKPAHRRWVESAFADARVDVFASTHTCLAALRRFDGGVVANNGAAGMPNFGDSRYGLLTRIALRPFAGPERLYGIEAAGARIDAYYAAHPGETVAIFFAVYVVVTGLSLPGAAILTLVAGALFGLLWGVVIVSFASTLGATLAFLASRYLLRDWVQGKFAEKLKTINAGVEREGAFYLFALRLVPAFPFFLINLVMGLTKMPTRTYFWVSQVGMLAGTIAYVYAGTQLGQFKISAGLIAAFVILGIFPLVAKKVLDALKARKVYAKWRRPASYDRNMVVIGAGSAGLVSAYIAAAVEGEVANVERHKMGRGRLKNGRVAL